MRAWQPLNETALARIIADTEKDNPFGLHTPAEVYCLAREVEQARKQLAQRSQQPAPNPLYPYVCCDCGLVETTADEVFCAECRQRKAALAVGPRPVGITTDRNDPNLQRTRGDGQQECYLVLSDEGRAKGFVRPVRRSYKHLACGTVTTMGPAIAETYARDPKFYSGTFCVGCSKHFPLIDGQGKPAFLWDPDGSAVGS